MALAPEEHKAWLLERINRIADGTEIPGPAFWEEIRALADRIVVHDIDGRRIRFDKIAEAEAALAEIEEANERLQRIIDDAARFIDARKREGHIEFPYDSRPIRKLREAAR